MTATTVSKGEFARLSGVTPGRVSQWISEGKISPDALDGEGRYARIKVDLAREQIRKRTDVGQSLGNGLFTRLHGPAPAEASEASAPRPSGDPVADAIKMGRLQAILLANERAAEERLAERGRYVLADQAQVGMTRVAATMLNVFEGGLSDLAEAVAAKFSLPARDVLHLARTEFRAVRARAADTLRREAQDVAPLIEDLVADAADPAAGQA